jgi:hypothetical protein
VARGEAGGVGPEDQHVRRRRRHRLGQIGGRQIGDEIEAVPNRIIRNR